MSLLGDLTESILDYLYGSLSSVLVASCGVAVGIVSLASLRLTPVAARRVTWWQLIPIPVTAATKVDKTAAVDAVSALGERTAPWGASLTIVRLKQRQPAAGVHGACEVYLAISGIKDPQDAQSCAQRVADSAKCDLRDCTTAPDLRRVPGRWRLSKVVMDTPPGKPRTRLSLPEPNNTTLAEWSTNAERFLQQGGAIVITAMASRVGSGTKVRTATTSDGLRGSWITRAAGKYRATNASTRWTAILLGPLASLAVGAAMVAGEASVLGSRTLRWVSVDAYALGWTSMGVAALGIVVQLVAPRLRWIIKHHAHLPLGPATLLRGGAVHRSRLAGWARPR